MPSLEPASPHIRAVREEGDTLLLTLAGEIDLNTSPAMRDDLLDFLQKTPAKQFVFDLAEVPYVDSSAIAVLVELLQRLRKVGGNVVLENLTPRVKGILQIAHLDRFFTVRGPSDVRKGSE